MKVFVCLCMQVCSVYLFHELPLPVRTKAVAEFLRVLRPGGAKRLRCRHIDMIRCLRSRFVQRAWELKTAGVA